MGLLKKLFYKNDSFMVPIHGYNFVQCINGDFLWRVNIQAVEICAYFMHFTLPGQAAAPYSLPRILSYPRHQQKFSLDLRSALICDTLKPDTQDLGDRTRLLTKTFFTLVFQALRLALATSKPTPSCIS